MDVFARQWLWHRFDFIVYVRLVVAFAWSCLKFKWTIFFFFLSFRVKQMKKSKIGHLLSSHATGKLGQFFFFFSFHWIDINLNQKAFIGSDCVMPSSSSVSSCSGNNAWILFIRLVKRTHEFQCPTKFNQNKNNLNCLWNIRCNYFHRTIYISMKKKNTLTFEYTFCIAVLPSLWIFSQFIISRASNKAKHKWQAVC